MGLDQSTRKDVTPTETDLQRMEQLLTDALDAGFVGMSTSQLQFDKLDGDVCRSRTLPSTFARRKERHRLNTILRRRGRVLQAAADVVNPTSVLSFLSARPGLEAPSRRAYFPQPTPRSIRVSCTSWVRAQGW